MKCPRCQYENRPQAKFCEECATPLSRVCSNCSAPLSPTAKFCPECAHPVAAGGAQPRFASPDSYTPKHLAEKILTSRSALEGERKQVTVLFADLKGSMELLADRDPEEARKLLDPILEHMMEAVHHYEGTVNQVMGDGIMALFGAPLAHEDHAVRACYAALRMQESVRRYADGVRRSHGIEVQIRVGLNSGEVVVRAIGSDLRMDYTAVGQTTHLAARMEQLATPGSTRITADTLRLAEGYVEVNPLGPVPIRGLTEPIEVYEITGAMAVPSRLQAATARGLTKFVGRASEIEQLGQALERAYGGHGQIVAVVGEPGIGKSRLYWEFTRSHRTAPWRILESRSFSYGKATSYLPVIDMLRAYFQIEGRDTPRSIREKVTGKLLSLDEALRPTLPAVLTLLDLPVEDATWQRLDPPQRRQCSLDAVRRLLLRESQERPLLVVFEDLHWIDGETQAFLDSLVESLPTARVLLLVNYRPEYRHGWGSKTYYRQLQVDPLPPESVEDFLHALLGDDPGLRSLTRLLIRRTEGNPFFLEESVRALVETGALTGERGTYRLARETPAIQIPATVQAVLAARIDRLSPEEKQLLLSAAVIGKDVPFALLQAIAELREPELRQGLARLQAAEFLYEAHLFPDLEYTFKHALTHEVAYGSLLREPRRALHVRIVSTIEQLYGNRVAEHTERLGDHAFRGEDWERAAVHLRRAGAKAMSSAAFQEAALHFGRALEALGHLPDTTHTLEQRADVRFNLHDALLPLSQYDRILDVVKGAEALAQTLDDRRRLGRAYSYLSHHAWIALGDNERAAEYAHRVLEIARVEANSALEIVANFYLGQIGHSQGALRVAVEAFGRNISALSVNAVLRPFEAFYTATSRGWAAFPYSDLGQFDRGFAVARAGLRMAESTGNPIHLMAACLGLGRLYLSQGDFQDAVSVLERAMAIDLVRDLPQWFPPLASSFGSALVMIGRADEGLGFLQEATRIYEVRKIAACKALWLVGLADGYLVAKRTADALATAEEALGLSRQRKERGFEAWALRLLGEIHSQNDSAATAQAEASYRQALTLGEELEMRPLVARCHNGLGKLYGRTDRREQGQEHFILATTMYREMDMRFWLKKAEAEMEGATVRESR